jgi:hypothetical protein
MKILKGDCFWGLFNHSQNNYALACIDVACPAEFVATDSIGDRYQIDLSEYALQSDIISLSDIYLPTTKL